jgi:heptose I phosphotransferase
MGWKVLSVMICDYLCRYVLICGVWLVREFGGECMFEAARNKFNVSPKYQLMLREIGLDAEGVFAHPDIIVWRKLLDRENCTLDADLSDGRHVRLHVKRYEPARGMTTPAEEESLGIRALEIEQIPTVPLVGWGRLVDGRSFLITEDLGEYLDAEKAVAEGLLFGEILEATADLAAKLHGCGLHHRDLYLCHFFVKPEQPGDVRLIDAARVKRLPGWLTRRRWIVKDLAQFWFSILSLPVTDGQRMQWLERYAAKRGDESAAGLRRAIERKAAMIARHDVKLRLKQKDRNISIPNV